MRIITDNGIFFEKNYDTIKKFYHSEPKFITFETEGTKFFNIAIKMGYNGTQIKRVYLKVIDVITKLGGLIKFFSLIGQLFILVSSEIEFYNDFSFNLNQRLLNIKNQLNDDKNKIESNKMQINHSINVIKNLNITDINSLSKVDNSHKQILSENQLSDNLLSKDDNSISNENHCLSDDANKLKISILKQFEDGEKSKIKILTFDESNKNYSTCSAFNHFFLIVCCRKNEITQKVKNLKYRSNYILSQENITEKFFQIDFIIKKLSQHNENLEKEFDEMNLELNYLEKIHEDCNYTSKNIFY